MRNESWSDTRTYSSTIDGSNVPGERVLADALHEIRVDAAFVLCREDRAFGVGADDDEIRLALLQVAPSAGDRSARANRDHQQIELVAHLLPDLGAGRVVVGLRIRLFEYWSGLYAPGISSASRSETE